MIRIFVLHRKQMLLILGLMLLAVFTWMYFERDQIRAAMSPTPTTERTIHLVTGEFEGKTAEGKEIEAYRWDPGTIVVEKGEKVKLIIRGVSGTSHPFIIEGLNIKGEVKQDKETVVTFQADKEGTYRLICLTHPDAAHNGPMIAYIVVD